MKPKKVETASLEKNFLENLPSPETAKPPIDPSTAVAYLSTVSLYIDGTVYTEFAMSRRPLYYKPLVPLLSTIQFWAGRPAFRCKISRYPALPRLSRFQSRFYSVHS